MTIDTYYLNAADRMILVGKVDTHEAGWAVAPDSYLAQIKDFARETDRDLSICIYSRSYASM